MKNLPKTIYLQIGEDYCCEDWNEIYSSHSITWEVDQINDNDIKYELAEPKKVQVDAIVTWQPYPQEKPDKKDRYLIYYKQGGVKKTSIGDYLPIEDKWNWLKNEEVLMWAKYNKPGK